MASDIFHQISLWTMKNIFNSPSDLFSLSNAITGLLYLYIVPTFTDFNIAEVYKDINIVGYNTVKNTK